MEDIKTGLPVDICIHLSDKDVTNLEDAAVSIDKYVLAHKNQSSSIAPSRSVETKFTLFNESRTKLPGFQSVSGRVTKVISCQSR